MGKKLEVQLNDRSQQVCFPLRKKHDKGLSNSCGMGI